MENKPIHGQELKVPEALRIITQLCDALEYAHNEGVIHRDIKPSNVMVDRRGRVKVADFGLAKLMGPRDTSFAGNTEVGTVMGTRDYMAPEQAAGREVDHRADIYSLGAMFYEMLTGEVPHGAVEPPSHRIEVDVRLDEVVLKALAQDPERRYQHASEVKTDVTRITEHPQVVATKGKGTLTTLVVAVLVLLAAGGFVWWKNGMGGTLLQSKEENTKQELPPLVHDPAISREVAEFILSKGGAVNVRQDGKEMMLITPKPGSPKLPEGDFRLTTIDFERGLRNPSALSPSQIIDITRAREIENLNFYPAKLTLDEAACRALGSLPRLRILRLGYVSTIEDDWMPHLGRLATLETITAGPVTLTDSGFEGLTGLRSLKAVDVLATRVTGGAIARHPMAANIDGLGFGQTGRQLDDELQAVLGTCHALVSLSVQGTVTHKGLQNIAVLESLNRMEFIETIISASLLHALAPAPQLREMILAKCKVPDDAWVGLTEVRNLTTLELSSIPWTPALEAALREAKHIRVVKLKGAITGFDRAAAEKAVPGLKIIMDGASDPANPGSDAGTPSVTAPDPKAAREIAELVLSKGGIVEIMQGTVRTRFTDPTKLPPGEWKITMIKLTHAEKIKDLNESEILRLLSAPGLENIHIAYSKANITRTIFERIANLPGLTSISFPTSRVTDDDLAPLAARTNIRKLYMHNSSVTVQGLKQLKNSAKTLRELAFGRDGQTEIDTAELTTIAEVFPNLDMIFLSGKVSPEAIEHLSETVWLKM